MEKDLGGQAEFLVHLARARNEWIQAQNYFEIVSEPDLVDFAIHKLEAARLKYMYFIKQARRFGYENRHILKEGRDEVLG